MTREERQAEPVIPKGTELAYLLERAIAEALPDAPTDLLTRALDRCGLETIGNDRTELLAFLSGALYEVVASELGEDRADELVSALGSKLERWAQHNRSGLLRRNREGPTSQATILVVDDEPAVVSAVARFLGEHGYRVVTAASAEEAMTMLSRQTFDLLLTDLAMPLMGGKQLAGLIQVTFGDSAPPVVALTGSMDAPLYHDDFAAILMKPVDGDTLIATVEQVLEASRLDDDDRS